MVNRITEQNYENYGMQNIFRFGSSILTLVDV